MPIYAYKCSSCGLSKDILRKISDPPLTTCPACGQETLHKQVTAAGFQLKGSGWYVTDFREGQKPAAGSAPQGTPDKDSTDATSDASSDSKTGQSSDTVATSTAAAATPAPAPAPTPTSGATT